MVNLSPSPPRGTYDFFQETGCWGEGSNQAIRGLLDTGSEMTWIPEDPPASWGIWGSGDGWSVSAQGRLTVGRGSPILSMVISLVLECKIGIDRQQLAESLPSVPGE